jgi:hypothetical protein
MIVSFPQACVNKMVSRAERGALCLQGRRIREIVPEMAHSRIPAVMIEIRRIEVGESPQVQNGGAAVGDHRQGRVAKKLLSPSRSVAMVAAIRKPRAHGLRIKPNSFGNQVGPSRKCEIISHEEQT